MTQKQHKLHSTEPEMYQLSHLTLKGWGFLETQMISSKYSLTATCYHRGKSTRILPLPGNFCWEGKNEIFHLPRENWVSYCQLQKLFTDLSEVSFKFIVLDAWLDKDHDNNVKLSTANTYYNIRMSLMSRLTNHCVLYTTKDCHFSWCRFW